MSIALRTSLWSLVLLASPACSVVNTDHCGNQNGHATCLQRDPAAPYCSLCVPDNNGCLADPPSDNCLADTATVPTTSASSTGSTSTLDPTTGTTTTGTTAPTTTAPDPTTTSTTGTTTTGISTDDISTSTGDPSTGDTSTGDTGTSTTMGGPVCGNNKAEDGEACDGTDFKGKTCETVAPTKPDGPLGCNMCQSINDTMCCVGTNGGCGQFAVDKALPCCGGLTCTGNAINGFKCVN